MAFLLQVNQRAGKRLDILSKSIGRRMSLVLRRQRLLPCFGAKFLERAMIDASINKRITLLIPLRLAYEFVGDPRQDKVKYRVI